MSRAVKFTKFGDVDVLEVVEVDRPVPKDNEVLVKVRAAGINPYEDHIRKGELESMFPTTFPAGEGSDMAGVIEEVGSAVTKFKVGEEVAGHTSDRSSHAEYAVTSEDNVTLKPANVSFEVAGSLYIVGTTAYAAVRAVSLKPDDKVVVSAAGGGVGSLAVQLAKNKGANVYGIAGTHDADWLKSRGITPISYDGDVASNIKEAVGKPDAFVDCSGKEYVKIAIELGVSPDRIDTVADFEGAQKYHVKNDGSFAASGIEVLKELLDNVADGSLEVPIAKTYKLEEVKEAYTFLMNEHHRGKVVLLP